MVKYFSETYVYVKFQQEIGDSHYVRSSRFHRVIIEEWILESQNLSLQLRVDSQKFS